MYAVSQRNIPNIFDCNLKTNYQILIIFDTNIPNVHNFLSYLADTQTDRQTNKQSPAKT